MNKIFLLSGSIHSGKTTRISEWISGKENIAGILQPVIDSRRYLKEISSGEVKLLEILPDNKETDIISVGNYKFSSQVFSWARSKLISAFNKNPEWMIIDEFGKLEINGRGLEPAISRIMNDLNDYQNINLVFVIRDYLVSQFLRKYGLNGYNVINLEI